MKILQSPFVLLLAVTICLMPSVNATSFAGSIKINEGDSLKNKLLSDVISLKDGRKKQVNVQKLSKNKVFYKTLNDSLNKTYVLLLESIVNIEYDEIVQIRNSKFEVINTTEAEFQYGRYIENRFLYAAFVNGAVGIVGIIMVKIGVESRNEAIGFSGFVTAVFGSRLWLPLLITSGEQHRRNRKNLRRLE